MSSFSRVTALLAGLVIAIGLVGCDKTRRVSDKDLDYVSMAEVRSLLSTQADKPAKALVVLIDPRTAERYAEGHIPGARNLRLIEVSPQPPRDPAIDRYKQIVVYGQNPGSAAAKAMAKRLMSVKYDDVYLFADGYDAWLAAGQPVERDTPQGE